MVVAIGAHYLRSVSNRPTNDPVPIVRAYLQANYARDLKNAYQYLSVADRRSRSEANFIESQGAYSGFALEAARMLSGFLDVWPVELINGDDHMRIKVGYRVPAPADLSGLLLNWDEARLNALPQDQQRHILAEIGSRRKQGRLLMIEGQESFELRREAGDWKIFLDWGSGTRVKLTAELPQSGDLDVRFAEREVIAKDDEMFLVNLVVKNRGARAVTLAVAHAVTPPSVADGLAMVECGLGAPVTLRAGSSQEFAMAYLLSAEARQKHREIGLAYVFSLK